MIKENIIFGIILFLIGLGGLIFGTPYFQEQIDNHSHIEKGECYDRYGNLINDVECDVTVYDEGWEIYGMFFFALSLIFVVIFIGGLFNVIIGITQK